MGFPMRGVLPCVFGACLGILPGAASAALPTGHAAAVDPRIGTGGDGHTFPGATVPFGMIQLSPDTAMPDVRHAYKWAAGYQYADGSIMGFSHTHFSGSGHSDLGDVLVMPISGEVKLDPGDPATPGSGYRSRYSHDSEVVQAGYYAVTLSDYGVRAELTAGRRIGWHRYAFPAGKPAHVLLDLRPSIYDYAGKVLWSSLRVRGDGTVTGCRTTRGWAPGRELCFALRFSQPMTSRRLLNRETEVTYKGFKGPGNQAEDSDAQNGRALVGVFDFGQLKRPLEMKVAISTVSESNAIANLDQDGKGWDFDARRAEAKAAWDKALAVIDVDAPASTRTLFYTALYHAMLSPTLSMDVNGDYRGPDHAVHRAKDFEFYSTWSLWDVYRAQQPLMVLLNPARSTDFIRSLIAAQQASPFGILPVWAYQGLETWCMIGYHAVPVIADAYIKGVRGFDADAAMRAMVASATYAPYGDLADYMKLGYVPIDKEPEGASKTLEYAYDDWAVAHLARGAGADDDYRALLERSRNYRHVFNRKSGFTQPRLENGDWARPFDPRGVGHSKQWRDFTESNAWQASFLNQHDVHHYMSLFGGREAFARKLDRLFNMSSQLPPDAPPDIAGMVGQYAHGNEPSHHIAYLYAYAGEHHKTQARVRMLLETMYRDERDGLAGNEDCGQMSAWYVLSALGFYAVDPVSGNYVIGSPLFDRAEIDVGAGRALVIEAKGNGPDRPYIQSLRWNGQPYRRTWLRHADLAAGGTLVFEMGATPNRDFGAAAADAPPSFA